MYFAIPHNLTVYLMFLLGLLMAIVAEKYVFADADLKSQALVGLVLMGAAEFISLNDQDFAVEGMYYEIIQDKWQTCKYHAFFLAWEFGLSLGIAIGFMFLENAYKQVPGVNNVIFNPTVHEVLVPGMIFTGLSLILYNFVVHPWYMKHRNR